MKNQPKMVSEISSVVAISLLFGLALAIVDAEQHAVDFSYSGPNGPSNWGNLKPEFSACSSGKHQSPVNIKTKGVVLNKNLKPLSGDYVSTADATLINLDHNIGMHYDGDIGSIVIDGKKYLFDQMHWHSPSEHLIDARRYPAEAHLVHKAEDRSAAVIGILFQYGKPNPLLAKLDDGLKKLSTKHGKHQESKVPVGKLDTGLMTGNTSKYYRYIGSYTTPPCTENVIWTVLSEVKSISKKQVAALKAPLGPEFQDNARPKQQLNDRKIELYEST